MRTDDLQIEPELSKAATLPSKWYTEAAVLPLEQARIFGATWQYAGEAAKVAAPGTYFTCEIGGEPMVVLRDAGGVLRAFHNVCRHRGGPVARGEGSVKLFKCAYHGWTYGLDGALRNTPEFAGVECFDKAKFGLVPAAVDVFGPLVFVHMGGGSPGLGETLGAIPQETARLPLGNMHFHKRVTYEVNCNWKVYVDNYLEGYHIPQVHLGLLRELDYPAYKVETHRYYSKQYAPIRNRDDSLYRRSLDAGAEAQALYYWIFPNIMLNIYPDNVQINAILPLGHNRTATLFEWYLADRDRPGIEADFQRSFDFSDTVQKEDITICEQVQKGLGSRTYNAGRYSVEREGGLHHFHRLYSEFMRPTPG